MVLKDTLLFCTVLQIIDPDINTSRFLKEAHPWMSISIFHLFQEHLFASRF